MFCRPSLSDEMKYTDKTRGVLSSRYYTRQKFDYQFRILLLVLRHALKELTGQSWKIHAPSLRAGWRNWSQQKRIQLFWAFRAMKSFLLRFWFPVKLKYLFESEATEA